MQLSPDSWIFWAILSAAFAALTAIFAKIGVANINSDYATLIRTLVILAVISLIVTATGQWQTPASIGGKTWIFLILSGLATGASWICYFRAIKLGDVSKVAPVDKFSLVLVAVLAALFLGERLSLANWLGILLIVGGTLLVAQRA